MTFDEFVSLLDKRNPLRDMLLGTMQVFDDDRLQIERKRTDLINIVRKMELDGLYPVVDRAFGVAIGIRNAHELLTEQLFRYFYHAHDPELKLPRVSNAESTRRYLAENHGYFISSTVWRTVILGESYVADEDDRSLFEVYTLDRGDVPVRQRLH